MQVVKPSIIHLSAVIIGVPAAPTLADAVFEIWIEAPEQVLAGDRFTIGIWGEVSGSVLGEGDGAVQNILADVVATGLNASFSTASMPFLGGIQDGTPTENALRDVVGTNDPVIWNLFTTSNPLLLFTTEVTTETGAYGDLTLSIEPPAQWGGIVMTWWVDNNDLTSISDTDPGSTRNITSATFNVIPSPGTGSLLALAAFGASRRQR
jgi:hypothetical protein